MTPSAYFSTEKYFGLLLKNEIDNLEKFEHPQKPFIALLLGNKISGNKIDVITSLLEKVDELIIGGGDEVYFFKSIGGEIQSSC